MNIVLVIQHSPETSGGGIAAYVRYLAIGLQRAGHRVRVITRMRPQSPARRAMNGVDVIGIEARALPYRWRRLPVVGRYSRFVNDLLYADAVRRQLLRLCAEQVPDVVEYADIDAEGLFHPFEVSPSVVKLHTPHFILKRFYTGEEMPYDPESVGWLEKRSILRAMGLSSPSRWLARAVADECSLSEENIAYVPNPIDSDFFSPAHEFGEEQPMILYVGRLEPLKGAITFAQAVPPVARRVPSSRFVLLGMDRPSPSGGSQKAELQAYFESQGVLSRVEFRGHSPSEVFRDYYRRATVFVMPSLFENCPYTLLEAMACGKAAVVSRAYGMQEMIVDGETGLFFEPGNPMDLAEKTIRLLESQSLREALGQGARDTVLKKYSLETGTEKTLAFYRTVLGQH